MNYLQGDTTETMLKNLLINNMGFNLWSPNTSELLEVLKKERPKYLDSWCANYQERKGRKPALYLFNSQYLLDHLYKLDIVLDCGAERIGFQATCNPDAVEEKVRTLRKFKPLQQAVGVNYSAVVLVLPGECDNLSEWGDQVDEVKEQIYDFISAMTEGEDCFTLQLP